MSAPNRVAPHIAVTLWSPTGRAGAPADDGLKLDWVSEVGRTGALLEWRPVGRGGDAGVPESVAQALASALCALGTVVGCTLDVPADTGPEWRPAPGGNARLFPGRRWPRRAPLGLLATRDPRVVAALFEDDAFPWALESQLLFVAAPDVLPELDRDLVDRCGRVPIHASASEVAGAGVRGLLRAGVDGDVAGLYALDRGWRDQALAAIAAAVAARGGTVETRHGGEHWSAPRRPASAT